MKIPTLPRHRLRDDVALLLFRHLTRYARLRDLLIARPGRQDRRAFVWSDELGRVSEQVSRAQRDADDRVRELRFHEARRESLELRRCWLRARLGLEPGDV